MGAASDTTSLPFMSVGSGNSCAYVLLVSAVLISSSVTVKARYDHGDHEAYHRWYGGASVGKI